MHHDVPVPTVHAVVVPTAPFPHAAVSSLNYAPVISSWIVVDDDMLVVDIVVVGVDNHVSVVPDDVDVVRVLHVVVGKRRCVPYYYCYCC